LLPPSRPPSLPPSLPLRHFPLVGESWEEERLHLSH
jgi:hypothetical protein